MAYKTWYAIVVHKSKDTNSLTKSVCFFLSNYKKVVPENVTSIIHFYAKNTGK